ncbi:2-oxo acid dehydrogenase subunit E2 [Natrarchaeobius chitinivorans]|uniref:2-oxo acid dehydrogenase subunit E2 n=1 Tax=Natrarchaeobius chitinivorans TaxID=1679083 RepID=A0A3N6PD61_NATCH|nr:2-oxo acid dehydrogenase subunit E2 [Natrarchaeobius chitinivorans]RQG94865.1 2-oxo acid dehydrogenase subunit E2 [Natrarchaeobius chitinivorans]
MGYIVRMPQLGMEMEQGTLLEWTVDETDSVSEGDVVAEIESEKTVADVEAREAGVLRRAYLEEGETVEPGDPIGIVAGPDEEISDLEAEIDSPAVDTDDESEPASEPSGGQVETASHAADAASASVVRASPRARKRANELGVDLSDVDGSGPGGAVEAADVKSAATAAAGSPAGESSDGAAPLTVADEKPLGSMRRTIADRLSQSYREAVHVTEHRKADAESLFAAADAADEALEVDVSISDVLLAALSATLEEHPEFNARFEDDVHRLYDEQNVGVAVDIDSGLISPVVPDIGEKSLAELSTARRETTRKALEGEYSMDDLSNGTFTVTNLGVLGIESFDPIINPPQVAILAVNAVQDVAVPDGDDVAFRRQLPFDLSFDHRVVDGADAARFLGTLVEHVEDPWPLLPDDVERLEAAPTDTEMPGRSVTARLDDGMAGTISAGSFSVGYDEPEDIGGSETGPTPVDLFLGSLAACLTESIQFQAVRKKDFDLADISVDVSAEPEHGGVESIDAFVEIDIDADDDTVDDLIEYGKRGCHVSQLVSDDVSVDLQWRRL